MSASPTEGTDMNQFEKVARAIGQIIEGPLEDMDSNWLGRPLWRAYEREAEAAIAAMQPAPQEPVGSPAEITRLTEALRAAEEREKALRAGLDRIAHRDPWTDPDSPERIARDTLAGAKP